MNKSTSIKNLFDKYQIDRILSLENKYLETLINRVIYEYEVFDKIGFSNSKYSTLSNFYIKSLIILGGALISIFRTLGIKTKKYKNNSSLIAIPFADHIIRFKHLQDISDLPIDIVYPPLFHFQNIRNHLKYFRDRNINNDIGIFSIKMLLKILWIVSSNIKNLKKCSLELDSIFNSKSCKLPGIIITALLYRNFISSFIKRMVLTQERRIWIFDYDFDIKYIMFNDEIHKLRPQDITIHIQHGSFFSYEDSYCNPVSDYSLCCSPREKKIISHYNTFHSKIYSLGAPLQSFIDSPSQMELDKTPSYDILVLLTDVYDKELKDKQVDYLKSIKNKNYRILLRYRPASKAFDQKVLQPYKGNAIESTDKTLQEDIDRSKIIISFSEDALYTAIRNNKKIILFSKDVPEKTYDFKYSSENMIIVESKEDIHTQILEKMILTYNNCNYNDDKFIQFNFGLNDLNLIKQNFTMFLKSLENE